jgi:hypothetical protein
MRVPARAAIDSVLSIIGMLVSLADAIYNLFMKIFFGITL